MAELPPKELHDEPCRWCGATPTKEWSELHFPFPYYVCDTCPLMRNIPDDWKPNDVIATTPIEDGITIITHSVEKVHRFGPYFTIAKRGEVEKLVRYHKTREQAVANHHECVSHVLRVRALKASRATRL